MDLKILVESALDPIHSELNKDVFEGNKIKKQLRNMIISNFENWLDSEIEIKKMCVIGSICGYQYTDFSDIDVNVVIDSDEKELNKLAKILPNGNLYKNHPINYYLTLNDENIKSAEASYDLINEKWLKKPSKDDVQVPVTYALEIARFFMDGFDLRIAEYERDLKELEMLQGYLKDNDLELDKNEIEKRIIFKKEELMADLDSINVGYKMLRAFRNEAFEGEDTEFLIDIKTSHPNKSINNIVYKLIERFGYMDKLHKYKKLKDDYKNV